MHPSATGLKRNEHRETILLVDDDPELLALTRDCLVGDGYHVLDAPGGEEALKVAEKYSGPIHLLLTDLAMPRLNGWMLAKQLRPLRPETKLLFMSAYSSKLADPNEILGAPQLTKPFHLADLAHKVREALGYRSPFARPQARERLNITPQPSERKWFSAPRRAAQ
jgi:two-component system, cell cycle sensor histidine kinase and response regulator CckA